jgi:RND family efflux transporter MFP subunit
MGFAGATVLAIGTSGCGTHEAKSKDHASVALAPAKVDVRAVHAATEGGALQAIGRVKNVRESTLTARAMGKIVAVAVKSGDTVKTGQVLARIDDADAQGRVAQARGAVAQAEAARVIAKQNLERFEKLRETDSASEAKYQKAVFDFQSAVGAHEQASGALRTAEAYLRETTIVAPFDGRVVDTLVEVGESAAPGQPVARLEGGSEMEFEATVGAAEIAAIARGQRATVAVDGPAGAVLELAGTVTEVVPAQDVMTHTSTVRIRIDPDARIRSGMFGRARFSVGVKSCPSVYVPADLVQRRGQLSALFVVDSGNALRLRLVTEGAKRGTDVEILSGLADGERLVVSDVRALKDGQPAQVVADTAPAAAPANGATGGKEAP